MAFEDGGRPAEETVAFVRRCRAAAERLGASWGEAEGQPVTAQLWQEFSTQLQLGNAELVLTALTGHAISEGYRRKLRHQRNVARHWRYWWKRHRRRLQGRIGATG